MLWEILNAAPVDEINCSMVTSGAISVNVNPVSRSTSNTAFSVIIKSTQFLPVRGKEHSDKILGAPFLLLCSCGIIY